MIFLGIVLECPLRIPSGITAETLPEIHPGISPRNINLVFFPGMYYSINLSMNSSGNFSKIPRKMLLGFFMNYSRNLSENSSSEKISIETVHGIILGTPVIP